MAKKILVVDDDESITEVIQIVLEGEGYEVEVSLDGSCIPNFPSGQPDLILLDILLHSKDGRKLCQQLKSNQKTSHIPVIVLSAHSDGSQAANDCGADDFLEKPFDVDVLISTAEKYLQRNTEESANYKEALG
jgi:DNA-binding response OmpR family regulator